MNINCSLLTKIFFGLNSNIHVQNEKWAFARKKVEWERSRNMSKGLMGYFGESQAFDSQLIIVLTSNIGLGVVSINS